MEITSFPNITLTTVGGGEQYKRLKVRGRETGTKNYAQV